MQLLTTAYSNKKSYPKLSGFSQAQFLFKIMRNSRLLWILLNRNMSYLYIKTQICYFYKSNADLFTFLKYFNSYYCVCILCVHIVCEHAPWYTCWCQLTTFCSQVSSSTMDSRDWTQVLRLVWQVSLPTEPA